MSTFYNEDSEKYTTYNNRVIGGGILSSLFYLAKSYSEGLYNSS